MFYRFFFALHSHSGGSMLNRRATIVIYRSRSKEIMGTEKQINWMHISDSSSSTRHVLLAISHRNVCIFLTMSRWSSSKCGTLCANLNFSRAWLDVVNRSGPWTVGWSILSWERIVSGETEFFWVINPNSFLESASGKWLSSWSIFLSCQNHRHRSARDGNGIIAGNLGQIWNRNHNNILILSIIQHLNQFLVLFYLMKMLSFFIWFLFIRRGGN
jgi:hypothetical protein